MTINLALEYIPRRMHELGFKSNYHIRFRHLVMQPNEKLVIKAYNQYYILVEEANNFSVESEFGVFDISSSLSNEMQYEHQGIITINNLSNLINHIRFIQVIPQFKNNGKELFS